MDRGAWQPTVHGVEKSQTQLSDTQGQPLSTLNQTSSSLSEARVSYRQNGPCYFVTLTATMMTCHTGLTGDV